MTYSMYQYFHCPFELLYGVIFLQQLATMFITRCLVVFLVLFALSVSPFALELKYEVGVWVKLT